ncbi:MAG: FAD-dependent oxidoreductase [Armatimonadetes bacterium]|nr:FAD-dependent oxidoreductase [Armatimonadota bacterium]
MRCFTLRRYFPLLTLALLYALPAAAEPAIETGVPAAPLGLRIIDLAPDRISLDWLPPEKPVAGYRLYRDGRRIAELPGDALSYVDTGLKPSTLYIYRLTAFGAGDLPLESDWSQPAADFTLPPATANAPRGNEYDVVVVGATPGGIGAALAASRLGATVALVEPSRWIGGMMAGGLSNTDYRFKETHGSVVKGFAGQVLDYYRRVYGPDSRQVRVSIGGYKFEPRVARAVLTRMIAQEPRISLYRQWRATGVEKEGNRVTAVTFEDLARGGMHTLRGKFIIDATYEGDIAAYAGAEYRVGRESRDDYNERHAGEIFWNLDEKKIVWGSGAGDRRVQAYNYRLCMTTRPDLRLPAKRPEGYDRTHYLKIIGDARSGYATVKRVLGLQGALPNDKWDINNSGGYWPSTDFVGANYDYPEADWQRREEIIRAHRAYVQGLLYFIQNDPELPEEFRKEANRWGLCRDEFVDNDNWPTQLYIREGRRIVGEVWFTENDERPREGEERSPLLPHGIAVGDYPLDSHATQVPKPDQPHLIEGFFYGGPTQPYQIPMGIMIPRGLEGLLVPVAVSATHIAFSTIRMEPTWMALGYAAGTAAYVSIRHNLPIREVPPALVQDVTLLSHQVTLFLKDVPYQHRDFAGLNYGGLIGLFPTYEAKPDEALDRGTAAQWLWKWMRVRRPGMEAPREAPQFSDLGEDSPVAPAARVLAATGVMGPVPSGEAFRPDEALTAADAIQWIARAHGASDPTGRSPRVKAELEQSVRALLEDAVQRAPEIEAEKVTRGQFLRLLYLAAQVGLPASATR